MYRGDPGGLICSAGGRDIAFPLLYRVVQSLSARELRSLGADGTEPFEGCVHFTIHGEAEADQIPGTQFRAPVLGLRGPGDDCRDLSLVIRWHPSLDHWEGYFRAVADIIGLPDSNGLTGVPPNDRPPGELCQTDDGIFSMEWRPTDPAWPAPLVIYVARVPLPPGHRARAWGVEEADWHAAFTPDDVAVRVADLFGPNPE